MDQLIYGTEDYTEAHFDGLVIFSKTGGSSQTSVINIYLDKTGAINCEGQKMSVWGSPLHLSRTPNEWRDGEQSKVAAIHTFEVPKTMKDMQNFQDYWLVSLLHFHSSSLSSTHLSHQEGSNCEDGLG